MTNETQGIDLFEDYENIPANVDEILNKYSKDMESGNYQRLQKVLNKLEEIGYTFDYYLDATPYDLRPIGTIGKTELFCQQQSK